MIAPHEMPRRGVALPAALGAIALLAALALAGVAAARDELRAAQSLGAGLRARTAAEGAALREVAAWDPERNIRLPIGGAEASTPSLGASVRTVRTGPRSFVVEGRATEPAGPPEGGRVAIRRVRLLVRLRDVAPQVEAAVTAAGPLTLAAGAALSGADALPPGWTDCGNWNDALGDLAAVAGPVPDSVRVAPGASVVGPLRASERAGLASTYLRLGEESWESLAARATVVVDGAAPLSPLPREGSGACLADDAVWGEPRRGVGAVSPCERASPVVHARGAELVLRGPARGQGVLLVDGDLRVEGDVEYAGLVLVRGVVHAAAGALRIRGILMIAGADRRGASEIGAGSDVAYSSCAVARASIAAGRPAPIGRRAWSEVTR